MREESRTQEGQSQELHSSWGLGESERYYDLKSWDRIIPRQKVVVISPNAASLGRRELFPCNLAVLQNNAQMYL